MFNLKDKDMKTFYVVQYNDCYGNGEDKNLEIIVENEDQFHLWLEEHNKNREAEGECEESEEEFDLIPLELFEPQPRYICNSCKEHYLKEDMKIDEDGDDFCINCK